MLLIYTSCASICSSSMYYAQAYIDTLLVRLTGLTRKHCFMLLLMALLRHETELFQEFPIANDMLWLLYVLIFCTD